jgi:hypothetical protein
MSCSVYRQLENDLEQAVAPLAKATRLMTSGPNAARDENLRRLGGVVTEAGYKLSMHVTNCRECSKGGSPTAGYSERFCLPHPSETSDRIALLAVTTHARC